MVYFCALFEAETNFMKQRGFMQLGYATPTLQGTPSIVSRIVASLVLKVFRTFFALNLLSLINYTKTELN